VLFCCACAAEHSDWNPFGGGKADNVVSLDGGDLIDADVLDAADSSVNFEVFDQEAFAPELLREVDDRECISGSFDHLEACAVATYQKFWDQWNLAYGENPSLGDVLTAVYRGELYSIHGFGSGVQAVALEGFARFFWRAIGSQSVEPDRLVVFLGSMHAWYLYGPEFMKLRKIYLAPEEGLREQVREAIADVGYSKGAVAGRPVDWANWGQGKLGFNDFKDGIVEGEAVPLVIRFCSLEAGFDYYFGIVAPGQSSFSKRPPSTAGKPLAGDSTCGIYVQNCPACP
jgi:hypothetical protein